MRSKISAASQQCLKLNRTVYHPAAGICHLEKADRDRQSVLMQKCKCI